MNTNPGMCLLILMGALVVGTGCQRSGERDRTTASGPGEAQAAALAIELQSLNDLARVPVEVLEIQPRTFAVRSSYTGTLQPLERITLKAEIEGTVERVSFEEGRDVARGAELARIDTRQVQVRRDQARSDLALAESNFERARTLADKGLLPASELDQARNRRDSARHTLQSAEIELDKSVVTAPASGLVKTRAISAGEYVNKGQLLGELLAVHKLRARIPVPETEIRFFRAGKAVDVQFDALPSVRVSGVVITVGAEADSESRTFPVDVEVDNAGGRLRAGILARVAADLATHEDGILVPRHAILERQQGRVAFVAQDGRASARVVRTGAAVGEDVQVVEGLRAGERLIVTGQQRLGPDELIKVVSPTH